LDLIGFRRAVREGKCPIYVRGYSHVFVSGPSDGSECSDFVEIAECNGSYQKVYSRSKTRALVAAYANGTSPEPTRNTVVDTMVLRDRPFRATFGVISIVPNKPTAKSSATPASKPVPEAAMIPVLSLLPLHKRRQPRHCRSPQAPRRADNIRVDSAANQILVGYGSGGWWQSMPELSRGSPTFRCRFIRKGFNSIPQVVRSSSIAPSHIRSQLWIADQESWRQPGPSRSPATTLAPFIIRHV
jgi:hypothetical protein